MAVLAAGSGSGGHALVASPHFLSLSFLRHVWKSLDFVLHTLYWLGGRLITFITLSGTVFSGLGENNSFHDTFIKKRNTIHSAYTDNWAAAGSPKRGTVLPDYTRSYPRIQRSWKHSMLVRVKKKWKDVLTEFSYFKPLRTCAVQSMPSHCLYHA